MTYYPSIGDTTHLTGCVNKGTKWQVIIMPFNEIQETKVRLRFLTFFFSLLLLGAVFFRFPASAKSPVIQAVLFYSPSCSHCHKVITEDLPPLLEIYPEQLEIIGIDITTEEGQRLYQAAIERFDIPDERRGVPTLILGETVLVGSVEIPEQLPALIERSLAQGGQAWPDIPELQTALQSLSGDGSTSGRVSTQKLSLANKFTRDLAGNSLAVAVLLGMLASFIGITLSFRNLSRKSGSRWPSWVIPFLSLLGLGVAAYLSYVEISQTMAVCGPVGDCNTVQQSPYAFLMGIIPIGILGVAGYVSILISWLIQQYGPDKLRRFGALAVWGIAWFGTLFSIYLTFLEPFVIGATCSWCITSAVVITLILWASAAPAKRAWYFSGHWDLPW